MKLQYKYDDATEKVIRNFWQQRLITANMVQSMAKYLARKLPQIIMTAENEKEQRVLDEMSKNLPEHNGELQ